MKKTFILIALASVLMMPVSCVKEEIAAPEEPSVSTEFDLLEMSFKALQEGEMTRTSINLGNGTVSWEEGDKIRLVWELEKNVAEGTSDALTADDIVDGTATFAARIPSDFAKEASDYASRHLYAAYPETAGVDYSTGTYLYVTVPTVQDGTFASASIAMAKWSYNNPLKFTNLCGLLQVEVADENVRKIVVESKTDIAGKVSVGFDNNIVAVREVTAGEKSVTVAVNGAGTYYVAVLPGELEEVYFSLYDADGNLVGDRFANNAIPVARKQIRRLGTLKTGFDGRYYVKAGGSGDGSSWDNAASYSSLVTRLKATNSALNVYMAAGEYKTGSVASMGTANTSADVRIYGGYPADASGYAISGRNYASNAVVLDAESNDRILVLQRGAWFLDGLTFKNAMRASSSSDTGSALVIETNASSSFIVKNCTFENNENAGTAGGGAVRVSNGTVEMTNCKFTGNTASQFGSAIYVGGTGVLNMTGCTLSGNNVTKYDGTIYVDASATLNLDYCVFNNNTATRRAGAISAKGKVNAFNCDFDSNTAATDGGAVWLREGGELKAELCTFRSNVANGTGTANGGGAIYVTEASKVYLDRCFMANNTDKYNAHHIYANSQSSSVCINNSVIRGPFGTSTTQGSLLQIKGSNVIVNTTLYCQTGSWGAISLGSKTENGCRVINSIVINNSGSSLSFYSSSYYMQVYNTIYSANKTTDANYGQTFTDCLNGAINKSETASATNLFPDTSGGWTQKYLGTKFGLPGDRYIYVYEWNGTTTLGQVNKPSLSEVKTLISGTANTGPDFLGWLESDALKVNSVEALAVDIRGVSRNTDAMWPGSYEDAAMTSVVENLNVK